MLCAIGLGILENLKCNGEPQRTIEENSAQIFDDYFKSYVHSSWM